MRCIFLILLVLLMASCTRSGENSTSPLPQSFTIHIVWSGTSSGATRIAGGNFTFEGERLVSGTKYKYVADHSANQSCTEVWANDAWQSQDGCVVDDVVLAKSAYRKGIEAMMKSGEVVTTQGACARYDYCYTLS
jgi:hypothetical protein